MSEVNHITPTITVRRKISASYFIGWSLFMAVAHFAIWYSGEDIFSAKYLIGYLISGGLTPLVIAAFFHFFHRYEIVEDALHIKPSFGNEMNIIHKSRIKSAELIELNKFHRFLTMDGQKKAIKVDFDKYESVVLYTESADLLHWLQTHADYRG